MNASAKAAPQSTSSYIATVANSYAYGLIADHGGSHEVADLGIAGAVAAGARRVDVLVVRHGRRLPRGVVRATPRRRVPPQARVRDAGGLGPRRAAGPGGGRPPDVRA